MGISLGSDVDSCNREQSPLAPDALELMRAAIGEGEVGVGDDVSDSVGDQHFAAARFGHYARGDVHGDPAQEGSPRAPHLCAPPRAP